MDIRIEKDIFIHLAREVGVILRCRSGYKGLAGVSGWTGDWHIQYFDPTGDLAVMTFALRLEKRGQVRTVLSLHCRGWLDI
jgi:hypothetical protein